MISVVTLVLVIVGLVIAMMYVRVYDGGDGICPDMTRQEIKSNIVKYAYRNNKNPKVDFDEDFLYLNDVAQWKVPYKVNGHRYVAKMTCKGWVVDNVGPYD
ncbi:hypothetical protein [Burkholderia oklahomensis]|uniref:hypothetical protein n=1 Tax=Burkholderia oklahomensis TaxID=342113 RepID=UPI001E45703D|nr:hypothetical protein [Burkholderia oklahomensis]